MRRQNNKTIDNNNIFDRLGCKPLRSNVVTPDILVGPTWLRNDQPSAVEIIELNSSNEEITPREPNRDSRRHAWSYVNNEEMQQIENSYEINKQARERRRLQNAKPVADYGSLEPNNWNNNSKFENTFYMNHANTYIDDKVEYNRNINHIGMINNNLLNSDSSTDGEYGDVEVITSADIIISGDNNFEQFENSFYDEEIITYDADLNRETRTIWIYSFKNKPLLRDDDFETVPCNESSMSSNSTDSSDEQTKDTSRRIGSPTPGTYIPKLDLSLVPTLSTVMEISERNIEPTPAKSLKSVKSTSRKMKVHSNNWCASEIVKESRRSVDKHEKSTNIIDWMSLSPRERRRVLKGKSVNDTWVGSYLNLSETYTGLNSLKTSRAVQNDAVKVQVDVEVHVNNEARGDVTKVVPNSAKNVVKANTDDISSINKIKYADAANEDSQKDRGDNDVKLCAPVIRLTTKLRKSDITKPIENLESPDWIHEKEEKETHVYDYVLETSESLLDGTNTKIDTVDQLWMNNTVPFLKPSEWTKFKPIADSPMSYHLSIGSIEERKSWYKRLINFLKCCK